MTYVVSGLSGGSLRLPVTTTTTTSKPAGGGAAQFGFPSSTSTGANVSSTGGGTLPRIGLGPIGPISQRIDPSRPFTPRGGSPGGTPPSTSPPTGDTSTDASGPPMLLIALGGAALLAFLVLRR